MTDDKKLGGNNPKMKKVLKNTVDKIVARQNDDIAVHICSFCGRDTSQVKHMIHGPAVNICDECITKCNQIITEDG